MAKRTQKKKINVEKASPIKATSKIKKNGKQFKTAKPSMKKIGRVKHEAKPSVKAEQNPNFSNKNENKKPLKRKNQDAGDAASPGKKPKHDQNQSRKPFKGAHAGKRGAFPQKDNFTRQQTEEKPDWMKLKQEKKELKVKRKQTNSLYELTIESKRLWEHIRRKVLKGGEDERHAFAERLHRLEKGHYSKLALAHDMARVVQDLLKHSPPEIRQSICEELVPSTVEMLQSKYARYCVRRMLEEANAETRAAIINSCYGNAVKLASHVVSAPIFEAAYAKYATQRQKYHLMQEFFGDIYKNSKDDQVKHIKDVYANSPSLRAATLSATKANLTRIFGKKLLDSELVQTILYQYLNECEEKDRNEMIVQLLSHCTVLSNSKDGARAVRLSLSKGTNKDRKTIIKGLKEHLVDLSKHEHGHSVIISLLDITDDTILLKKAVIGPLIENCKDLVANEWGRKVVLWLVTPADQKHFHPTLLKEMAEYRDFSTSKKSVEVRREEILAHVSPLLLESIASEAQFWFSTPSIALVTLAILTMGSGDKLKDALERLVEIIIDPNWKVRVNDEKEIYGIEDPGFHMVLKKLMQEKGNQTENVFCEALVSALTAEVILTWIKMNRGCFLLLFVLENGSESTVANLKEKLEPHLKKLKKQDSFGAKLLQKKLS